MIESIPLTVALFLARFPRTSRRDQIQPFLRLRTINPGYAADSPIVSGIISSKNEFSREAMSVPPISGVKPPRCEGETPDNPANAADDGQKRGDLDQRDRERKVTRAAEHPARWRASQSG